MKTKNNLVEKILTIIVISCIILIIGSVVFVSVNPISKERFTEFYLLDSRGHISRYPTTLESRDDATVSIGLSNHEQKKVDYTIEIWLINQSTVYDESSNKNITSYNNAWFMKKINVELDHIDFNTDKEWKSQWEYEYEFNINKNSGEYKLLFLLFTNPTEDFEIEKDYSDIIEHKINSAYQDLYIWIDVV